MKNKSDDEINDDEIVDMDELFSSHECIDPNEDNPYLKEGYKTLLDTLPDAKIEGGVNLNNVFKYNSFCDSSGKLTLELNNIILNQFKDLPISKTLVFERGQYQQSFTADTGKAHNHIGVVLPDFSNDFIQNVDLYEGSNVKKTFQTIEYLDELLISKLNSFFAEFQGSIDSMIEQYKKEHEYFFTQIKGSIFEKHKGEFLFQSSDILELYQDVPKNPIYFMTKLLYSKYVDVVENSASLALDTIFEEDSDLSKFFSKHIDGVWEYLDKIVDRYQRITHYCLADYVMGTKSNLFEFGEHDIVYSSHDAGTRSERLIYRKE